LHAQRETTIPTIEFHGNAGNLRTNPYCVGRENCGGALYGTADAELICDSTGAL
jgi:hypothetical protein